MGNMSYCRFTNTSGDLADCLESLCDSVDGDEHRARVELVKMCAEIVFNFAGADSVEEAVEWAKSLDHEDDE